MARKQTLELIKTQEEIRRCSDLITQIAAAIHYPECWDTTAFPTLLRAVQEMSCNPDCCTKPETRSY